MKFGFLGRRCPRSSQQHHHRALRYRPQMGALVMLAVLVVCVGCSPLRKLTKTTCHDDKPYMTAKSVPPLQIPPGLDGTDTGNAMKIPRLNEPAMPARKGKDPCLDEPPAFVTPKTRVPQA